MAEVEGQMSRQQAGAAVVVALCVAGDAALLDPWRPLGSQSGVCCVVPTLLAGAALMLALGPVSWASPGVDQCRASRLGADPLSSGH
jgi:hypothetical protein